MSLIVNPQLSEFGDLKSRRSESLPFWKSQEIRKLLQPNQNVFFAALLILYIEERNIIISGHFLKPIVNYGLIKTTVLSGTKAVVFPSVNKLVSISIH